LISLKDTPYYERGDFLSKKIERDLKEIINRQNLATVLNPEEHISVYRENLKSLDLLRQDLLEMERLSTRASRISPLSTWRMIILIIAFLGLLSVLFFFIWHTKLTEVAQAPEGPTKKEPSRRVVEAESREVKEEKKADIEEIKKRLSEPPEV